MRINSQESAKSIVKTPSGKETYKVTTQIAYEEQNDEPFFQVKLNKKSAVEPKIKKKKKKYNYI